MPSDLLPSYPLMELASNRFPFTYNKLKLVSNNQFENSKILCTVKQLSSQTSNLVFCQARNPCFDPNMITKKGRKVTQTFKVTDLEILRMLPKIQQLHSKEKTNREQSGQ